MIAVCGLALASAAAATPVELTEAQFTAQIAGKPTIVETFEGFPTGGPGSPFTIANGIYTGVPFIAPGAWCGFDDKCLSTTIQDGTFSSFPAGTTHWSTLIGYGTTGQVVQATVTGNSGVLQFDLPPSPAVLPQRGVFFGFFDPTGLQSVKFHLPGFGGFNYGFDDVTTAAIVAPTLDVDGNGTADPLTDGLLIIRYLFGLRGDALIAGAVAPLATRTTAEAIESYLQSLLQ